MSQQNGPNESKPLMSFFRSTTDYSSTGKQNKNANFVDLEARNTFHLGMNTMNRANIMTSLRYSQSFIDHGEEYQMVPTLLLDNCKLVADHRLSPSERGSLYYAESSFYNKLEKPHYCLTVHADIYQRVLKEVYDAQLTPFGFYFCCHGGDGAHAGVSHDDYVDISIAWFLLAFFFVVLMWLSAAASP
jgi:hypothetical protein